MSRAQAQFAAGEVLRLASTALLSQIENGLSAPSLDTLQLLAKTLRLPVTALLKHYRERGEATFACARATA